MSRAYVIFAEGFEEIEGLTVVDLLRRAEIEVVMTGLEGKEDVTGAHGIRVGMDCSLDQADLSEAAAIILPGGMPGTKNLGNSRKLAGMLKEADQKKIWIGAICAAPSVLGDLGLLKGRRAVCYPGFEGRLEGAIASEAPVEVDGHIITSRGMGTAIEFGLSLIAQLKSEKEAERIGTSIIYDK